MCLTRAGFFQPFCYTRAVTPSGIEEPRYVILPYDRGLLRPRQLSGLRMTRTANPAAAEDDVTVVNDGSLSRRYGTLRIMQSHMGAIILQWRNCRTRPGMVITDLDGRFE